MLHNPMTPHPFSRFVAILGRGKTKQRHLTYEEALEANVAPGNLTSMPVAAQEDPP